MEEIKQKLNLIADTIPVVMKYPALYNSVSNLLYKKFGYQSAELSLLCSYVTLRYIQLILSQSEDIESWDLVDSEIIYKKDILKLFHMEESD